MSSAAAADFDVIPLPSRHFSITPPQRHYRHAFDAFFFALAADAMLRRIISPYGAAAVHFAHDTYATDADAMCQRRTRQ